jgi:hypothetical protein
VEAQFMTYFPHGQQDSKIKWFSTMHPMVGIAAYCSEIVAANIWAEQIIDHVPVTLSAFLEILVCRKETRIR